jgi:hypothetical protein
MSHATHHERQKIACAACHHKHDNDERIKHCAQCHKGVAGIDTMHRACGACHERRGMDMRCASCHRAAGKPPLLRRLPESEIKLNTVRFSHPGHVKRKPDCASCHAGTQVSDWRRRENFPEMKLCLTCHDGRIASKSCSVCHNDVRQIKPESHNVNWLQRGGHGEQSLFCRKDCAQCHAPRECNKCHRGQTAFKIHPAGYRFTHGSDARSGASNCSMCHQTKLSCSRCHERKQ